MPRKDNLHDSAKNALIKDGWIITHDPYIVEYDREKLYIDLGAEAPIGAEKGGRKIAVEVKSFLGKSGITDLERALGQYILYRNLLRRLDPDRVMFLAMPIEAFNSILDVVEGRDMIVEERLKLVLFDAVAEAVERWIE